MTGPENDEVLSLIAANFEETESIVTEFNLNGYDEIFGCDIYEHEDERYCCEEPRFTPK